MTTGVATTASQVMIFRVYGLDEALVTVRLQAGSSVDGLPFGKRVRKSMATAATIVTPDSMNDQPSRPARLATRAAASEATATTRAIRLVPSPLRTWVHSRKPSAR